MNPLSQKDQREYIEEVENDMEGYTLPKDFIKLSLDKIRECIAILEEHYNACVEKQDVMEAKRAKQRIILFKRMEKAKIKLETQVVYSNQQELVENKMKSELDDYIENTKKDFQAFIQVFEQQEDAMSKEHEKELKEWEEKFEEDYEKKRPKPSKECLNWKRIKEYALGLNKFDKVKEATMQIEKLQKIDEKKFLEEKNIKKEAEKKGILHRQENEKNGLSLKKRRIIDMFNSTKEKNIEQIQKKYESKLKELINYQNFEMSNIDKITKNIMKPCSRIQSIVSSATVINDGDEGEEEEEELGNNVNEGGSSNNNQRKEGSEEEIMANNQNFGGDGEENNANVNMGMEMNNEANEEAQDNQEGEEEGNNEQLEDQEEQIDGDGPVQEEGQEE